MLVLSRKPTQSIRIGDDIVIHVLSVRGQQVRLAIDAPREIPIVRSELLAALQAQATSPDVNAEAPEDLVPPALRPR